MLNIKGRIFLLITVLTLVCSVLVYSGVGSRTDEVSPKKYRLQYKARKGEVLQYKSTSESVRAMDRGEQIFEMTSTRDFAFSLEAEEPGDLLGFVLTIDNIKTKFEGGMGNRDTDMSGYKGKRIHVKVTSLGEQKEITAIDSLPVSEARGNRRGGRGMGGGRRRNRAAQFGVGFFQLPDKEVGVGDSWTETKKDTVRPGGGGGGFGMNQIEERTTKYTVVGEEKKKGMECLQIKAESTYSREGYGTMGDNEMSSEFDGESTAEVWFAPEEGLLVEYITTDFSEGTMAFSGGDRGGTMSSISESKGTLKLVKWKKKK